MKIRGPMAVGALVLGLGAFQLGWGSDGASNGASAASFLTPNEVRALAADTVDEIGSAEATDGPDASNASIDDDDDDGRRWWRSRRNNAWDGPIPTPADAPARSGSPSRPATGRRKRRPTS